jgi:competence ComEA-like helix-hairpin-helix protein
MAIEPDKPAAAWTRHQRAVLIALVLLFSAVLLIRVACNKMYVKDPPPPRAARYDELADRIDPNTATWRELAVLPSIGESRAKEIVAYREQFVAAHPGPVPFATPEDLQKVKGIGPAMLQTLRPFLVFPGENPATTQAYNPR